MADFALPMLCVDHIFHCRCTAVLCLLPHSTTAIAKLYWYDPFSCAGFVDLTSQTFTFELTVPSIKVIGKSAWLSSQLCRACPDLTVLKTAQSLYWSHTPYSLY